MNREAGCRRLLPSESRRFSCGLGPTGITQCRKSAQKGPASGFQAPLSPEASTHSHGEKEEALPRRNPRWSYKHVKCALQWAVLAVPWEEAGDFRCNHICLSCSTCLYSC